MVSPLSIGSLTGGWATTSALKVAGVAVGVNNGSGVDVAVGIDVGVSVAVEVGDGVGSSSIIWMTTCPSSICAPLIDVTDNMNCSSPSAKVAHLGWW